MAASLDNSDTTSVTLPGKMPPNNNKETLQDLERDQLETTQHTEESLLDFTKSENMDNYGDSAIDVQSRLEASIEGAEGAMSPLSDQTLHPSEGGEAGCGVKPQGTPSGKLGILPPRRTSTPLQEPLSASARAVTLEPPLEQLSELSLHTDPHPTPGLPGQSLFPAESGSHRGQGSDSGSRADDEAEVNTSFASQVSTTTVTHESQTDLDLYDQINVPIIGYETVEPRNKFTIFKLRVQKSKDEGWYIFRRYSDFVRLNEILKTVFPHFRLALPPKRWFGDNFDRQFIDERMLGLQAFLNNIVSHRDVCNSEAVQMFLCIDDPPGPHDSLEESRALCDMLEGKLYQLKENLQTRDAKIALLEEEIALYKHEVENLRRALSTDKPTESHAIKHDIQQAVQVRRPPCSDSDITLSKSERSFLTHRRNSPTSQPSESSLTEQDEASEAEADQIQDNKSSSTITSPEEVQSDVSHVTTGFESNPLSAVDNLLSLDEEIKEMEKLWKKSSLKSPIPTSKEAPAEKLGDKGLSSSKGLPAPAILSQ